MGSHGTIIPAAARGNAHPRQIYIGTPRQTAAELSFYAAGYDHAQMADP